MLRGCSASSWRLTALSNVKACQTPTIMLYSWGDRFVPLHSHTQHLQLVPEPTIQNLGLTYGFTFRRWCGGSVGRFSFGCSPNHHHFCDNGIALVRWTRQSCALAPLFFNLCIAVNLFVHLSAWSRRWRLRLVMNLVKRDKIDITQQCSVDEIIINIDGEAEGGVRGFLQLWVNWEGMSPSIFFKIDSDL